MEGQVTRAEAIRTIRGFLDTLPEESPYRGLTNQQIMECFPFEDRRLFVPRQDAAVPSEVVPREDVAAVIDVLGIYAEDGRAITNLIDPFQDIQEDVRAFTSERIVRRTAEERADLMYLAEQTDPEYNRSVVEYARLRPDGDNVSFGRAITVIRTHPESEQNFRCGVCFEGFNEDEYINIAHALHLTPTNDPHIFICGNCLIGYLLRIDEGIDQMKTRCFHPTCNLGLYENMLYKTLVKTRDANQRAEQAAREARTIVRPGEGGQIPLNPVENPSEDFLEFINRRRTAFSLKKSQINIFDDESNVDVYLEHFFRIQEVTHIDFDNVETIRLQLHRRGLIITDEQLREKIEEYNNRPEVRIRGILTELIAEEDHEISNADLEIVRESLGLIGIDTTVEQLREMLTLIDEQKAAELGIEVANVITSRAADHVRKREVFEKRRAEGAAGRAANAEQQRLARTIADIQRLRAAGQNVAIDWSIDGDDFPLRLSEGINNRGVRITKINDNDHTCPYCFKKEQFLDGCAYVFHVDERGRKAPCPIMQGWAPVAGALRDHPWLHGAYPEWCRICGRSAIPDPTGRGRGHFHQQLFGPEFIDRYQNLGADGVERNIYAAVGYENPEAACIRGGGGDRVEFFVRVLAIRHTILEDLESPEPLLELNNVMKARIYRKTMSPLYLGSIQEWITAGRPMNVNDDRFGNVVRQAIEIVNRSRREAQEYRGPFPHTINRVFDPPMLRPDWIQGPRFVGGSRSKTVRRQTYKKRSKNKHSRRSKYSRK
jgi:hypothetical protein